jgi:hypothetical protein
MRATPHTVGFAERAPVQVGRADRDRDVIKAVLYARPQIAEND